MLSIAYHPFCKANAVIVLQESREANPASKSQAKVIQRSEDLEETHGQITLPVNSASDFANLAKTKVAEESESFKSTPELLSVLRAESQVSEEAMSALSKASRLTDCSAPFAEKDSSSKTSGTELDNAQRDEQLKIQEFWAEYSSGDYSAPLAKKLSSSKVNGTELVNAERDEQLKIQEFWAEYSSGDYSAPSAEKKSSSKVNGTELDNTQHDKQLKIIKEFWAEYSSEQAKIDKKFNAHLEKTRLAQSELANIEKRFRADVESNSITQSELMKVKEKLADLKKDLVRQTELAKMDGCLTDLDENSLTQSQLTDEKLEADLEKDRVTKSELAEFEAKLIADLEKDSLTQSKRPNLKHSHDLTNSKPAAVTESKAEKPVAERELKSHSSTDSVTQKSEEEHQEVGKQKRVSDSLQSGDLQKRQRIVEYKQHEVNTEVPEKTPAVLDVKKQVRPNLSQSKALLRDRALRRNSEGKLSKTETSTKSPKTKDDIPCRSDGTELDRKLLEVSEGDLKKLVYSRIKSRMKELVEEKMAKEVQAFGAEWMVEKQIEAAENEYLMARLDSVGDMEAFPPVSYFRDIVTARNEELISQMAEESITQHVKVKDAWTIRRHVEIAKGEFEQHNLRTQLSEANKSEINSIIGVPDVFNKEHKELLKRAADASAKTAIEELNEEARDITWRSKPLTHSYVKQAEQAEIITSRAGKLAQTPFNCLVSKFGNFAKFDNWYTDTLACPGSQISVTRGRTHYFEVPFEMHCKTH